MTSGAHQKSSILYLLVSIKWLMVASILLVLLTLSKCSLPSKKISVIWSLLKPKILGTVQEGLSFMQIVWTVKKVMRYCFNIFVANAYRIKSILKTVLKLVFTKVTRPTLNLVNNWICLGLWQLSTLFWDDHTNFKMLFLKILRLSDFRILFRSVTVEGKKEFF